MTGSPPHNPQPPQPRREAHAHLHMLGRSLSMLSLAECGSLEQCLDHVRAEASMFDGRRVPADHWLLACAMRVEGWREPRWPTRAELDAACPGRPAALMSFDHHSVAVNSRAFAAAGFSDQSPDPEGGVIVRDRAGTPTGVLLESAAKKAWSATPEPAPADRPALVRAALSHLRALGFREVHDLLSPAWLGPLLAELADHGELMMDVGLYPLLPDLAQVAAAAERFTRPGVRLMGGKVFADGTLNSRTAWMLDPYADAMPEHPRGVALMHAASLRAAMEAAQSLGVGLAVHAIGDGAVRATLDAWELCDAPRDGRDDIARTPHGAPLLRIEHCEIIDALDVPRFARLGVACSVQPCHLLADVEVLRRAVPHRLHRVLPLRELVDTGTTPGARLLFGSDVPIVRADPADSLQAAVHRRRAGTPASEAIAPEQALTLDEAVSAFGPPCG